jgi:hypothetical protein
MLNKKSIIAWRTTVSKESQREDLNHKPENAGKVGAEHKKANQEGEKARSPSSEESEDKSKPV